MAKTYEITLDNGKVYEIDVEDNAPPSVPNPIRPGSSVLPGDLSTKWETNSGGSGNGPGLPSIVVKGIKKLLDAGPAFSNSPARGVSNTIEGLAETASPLAIPALIGAPIPTLLGGGLSALLGHGAQSAADSLHADPETSNAIGDVASLVGGGVGSKLGTGASGAVVKGAVKGGWKGGTEPVDLNGLTHGRLGFLLKNFPSLPSSIVGGVAGAGGTRLLGGGPEAEAIGATVGALGPVVRGAIEGGKSGLTDYRRSIELAGKPNVDADPTAGVASRFSSDQYSAPAKKLGTPIRKSRAKTPVSTYPGGLNPGPIDLGNAEEVAAKLNQMVPAGTPNVNADPTSAPASRFEPGQYDAPRSRMRVPTSINLGGTVPALEGAPKAQLSGAAELAAKIEADLAAEKATKANATVKDSGSISPEATALADKQGLDVTKLTPKAIKDLQAIVDSIQAGKAARVESKQPIVETPDMVMKPGTEDPADLVDIPDYMKDEMPYKNEHHAKNGASLLEAIQNALPEVKPSRVELEDKSFWDTMSKKLGRPIPPDTIKRFMKDYDPGPQAFSKGLLGDFATANGMNEQDARKALEAEGWTVA